MEKSSSLSLTNIKEWIDAQQARWLEEYFTFLRFPSISSEPQYRPALLDCMQWLAQTLKEMQFEVDSWPTSGHPVLFATDLQAGADKPTLLIYHHYDVQPADPLEKWLSPPFEPTIREGKVYARGAQDNKGQCFYVLQALKLLKEQLGALPLNIKLCIEGEEEIGSAGLSGLLQDKKEALKADYLAIIDLGLKDLHTPTLTLGLRGIVTADVQVKGSSVDLHSGSHGGIVANPIHVLVQLLAGLRDAEGKVTVPGFYDDVREVPPKELADLSLHFDEEEYRKQTGAYAIGGERNHSILERNWLRPTLEINGIHGGYTGEGFKTVISSYAKAKISCRLVPDQDPAHIAECLIAYFKENAPFGVEVSVHIHPGQGKAVRIDAQSPLVRSFGKAFEEIFQKPCQFILSGASIPIVAELKEACGGDTVLLGLGLDTDLIHAPNEHFGVDRIKKGIMLMARVIPLLSKT